MELESLVVLAAEEDMHPLSSQLLVRLFTSGEGKLFEMDKIDHTAHPHMAASEHHTTTSWMDTGASSK